MTLAKHKITEKPVKKDEGKILIKKCLMLISVTSKQLKMINNPPVLLN